MPGSDLPIRKTPSYADHYHTWSSAYDTTPEVNAITHHLNLSDKTLLETGCGTGRLTTSLAEHTDEYIATEQDPRLLSVAAEQPIHHDTTLSYINSSPHYLPANTDSIDVVVNSWSIDETRIGHYLKETDRVLHDNGDLIIIEEAWGTPERTSDYYRILKHIHPGADFHTEQSRINRILREHYDTTPTTAPITTTYTYPDKETAIEAFAFHIYDDTTTAFTPRERDHLQLLLGGFEQPDGSIELTEQATIAHYNFTSEPR